MDNRIITTFDLQNHNETILNVNNIKNFEFIKNKDNTYSMYVEDNLFLENVSEDDKNQIKSFIKTGSEVYNSSYTGYRGYRYLEMLIQTNCLKLKYLYFTQRIDK